MTLRRGCYRRAGPLPPEIFSLVTHSVIGELGDRTEIEQPAECPVCQRRPGPRYGAIENGRADLRDADVVGTDLEPRRRGQPAEDERVPAFLSGRPPAPYRDW